MCCSSKYYCFSNFKMKVILTFKLLAALKNLLQRLVFHEALYWKYAIPDITREC